MVGRGDDDRRRSWRTGEAGDWGNRTDDANNFQGGLVVIGIRITVVAEEIDRGNLTRQGVQRVGIKGSGGTREIRIAHDAKNGLLVSGNGIRCWSGRIVNAEHGEGDSIFTACGWLAGADSDPGAFARGI